MIEMPDVNVLIALLDGLHVHHRAAKRWFDQASLQGWATCPLTQNGALRVISRPQSPRTLLISEARDLLCALIQANQAGHHFWLDDVSLLDESGFDLEQLQSYRQLTDLHLLGIAQRHGGALVTLDTGLARTLKAIRSPAPHLLRLLTP